MHTVPPAGPLRSSPPPGAQPDDRTRWVYKIVDPGQWRILEHEGQWSGAPIDHTDGYIHLSAADQVQGTLARHFGGAGPLLLLQIDPSALPSKRLIWEISRGGALFPHLYAPLSRTAVTSVLSLTPTPSGGHEPVGPLPDRLGS